MRTLILILLLATNALAFDVHRYKAYYTTDGYDHRCIVLLATNQTEARNLMLQIIPPMAYFTSNVDQWDPK